MGFVSAKGLAGVDIFRCGTVSPHQMLSDSLLGSRQCQKVEADS